MHQLLNVIKNHFIFNFYGSLPTVQLLLLLLFLGAQSAEKTENIFTSSPSTHKSITDKAAFLPKQADAEWIKRRKCLKIYFYLWAYVKIQLTKIKIENLCISPAYKWRKLTVTKWCFNLSSKVHLDIRFLHLHCKDETLDKLFYWVVYQGWQQHIAVKMWKWLYGDAAPSYRAVHLSLCFYLKSRTFKTIVKLLFASTTLFTWSHTHPHICRVTWDISAYKTACAFFSLRLQQLKGSFNKLFHLCTICWGRNVAWNQNNSSNVFECWKVEGLQNSSVSGCQLLKSKMKPRWVKLKQPR